MANEAKIEETLQYIESIRPEQFNMSVWGHDDEDGCGTVACLAGWRYAMDYGKLRTEGVGVPSATCWAPVSVVASYARKEFDLTFDEANALFHSVCCKTPEELRIRVKDVLAGNFQCCPEPHPGQPGYSRSTAYHGR